MVYAQTKIVNMPKAGKLKSLIKKNEYSNIKKLVIIGEVNNKDLKFINKLSNIVDLDLKEAKGILTVCPVLPNLKVLSLSKDVMIAPTFMEGFTECSNIEALSLTQIHFYDEIIDYYKRFPKLKKISVPYFTYRMNPLTCNYIPIDTLVITDRFYIQDYKTEYFSRFNPSIVISGKNVSIINNMGDIFDNKKLKGINALPPRYISEQTSLMENVRNLVIESGKILISEGYYNYSNIINLSTEESNNAITIDENSFLYCEKLQNIIFNRPVIINSHAFERCKSLSKIHFKKGAIIKDMAFSGCNVDSVIFDDSDVTLGEDVFETLKYVFFNKPPKKIGKFVENKKSHDDAKSKKTVAVISREYNQIVKENNPEILTYDPYYNLSYEINIQKPGTILSYIPVDSLERVESLTIEGIMYETDVEVLNNCINLKYLDLTDVIIIDSPEKNREELADKKALSAIFSLMNDMADVEYQNDEMNTIDYILAKRGINAIVCSNEEVEEICDLCNIPPKSFMNLRFLEEVKLPKLLSKIYAHSFKGCYNLKKVIFPNNLKEIHHDAFYGCKNLTYINLPKSLNYVGGYHNDYGYKAAFGLCPIKVIDLKECVFDEWWRSFSETDYEIIYFPELIKDKSINISKNVKKIYLPYSVTELEVYSDCINELHFKNSIPPKCNVRIKEGCVIYCPKGSLTAYFNVFGKSCKYIEE